MADFYRAVDERAKFFSPFFVRKWRELETPEIGPSGPPRGSRPPPDPENR